MEGEAVGGVDREAIEPVEGGREEGRARLLLEAAGAVPRARGFRRRVIAPRVRGRAQQEE
jgi:hypothetical protein